MAESLYQAKEVREIAEKLIADSDSGVYECGYAHFAYLFREEAKKAGDCPVLWEVRKASDILRGMLKTELDLVMVVAADEWLKLEDDEEKEALVHEALCSVVFKQKKDGSHTFSLQKPDIAHYSKNVERYGCWNERMCDSKNSFNSTPTIDTV